MRSGEGRGMAVEIETPVKVDYADVLKRKFREHTATVVVVGAGYVGLPLAVEKAKVGFPVVCLDRNGDRVAQVNRGENYIRDVKDDELKRVVADGKLRASTDFSEIANADVVIICVPTPLTIHREPDLQYVRNVTSEIAKHMHAGMLVSLESTTYPGTTEEVILPELAATGLKVGEDFFLVHSPERVDPGNARYTTQNTNKLVGGVTKACTDVGAAFYSETIVKVIKCSSPAIAEMAKVFENTYRAVNIALVNEMALLCDRMGISVWEMLDAAFTKPFGIQPFYPGPGVGGHCIPVDPFYLAWKAREYDFSTRFIELAGEINLSMPYFVVQKAERILGMHGRSLRGAKVLVLGVAYKEDLPDTRESPALKVIQLLLMEGSDVEYYDPYVPSIEIQLPNRSMSIGRQSLRLDSIYDPSAEAVSSADLVAILTGHSSVDYGSVLESASAVLDTRNVVRSAHGCMSRVLAL
jgi:UDP-N-acetyl-D-glucosamine dehydrogenase